MITSASRSLFAVAVAALIAAVGYAVVVTEHAGAAVLFFVSGAATIAGLALLGGDAREVPLDPTATAAPPSTDPSLPSVWPMLSAVAAAVLAVGLAVGPAMVVPAVVVFLLALAGWLGHSWIEHPSWDSESGQRVLDRLLAPVALPVGTMLLVGVIAISFSRVLLAVSKTTSTVIALVAALAVLGVCSLVALRPPRRSSVLVALAVVGALLTVTAGVGGAVAGERDFHHAGESAEHEDEAEHEDGAKEEEDAEADEDDHSTATTEDEHAAAPTTGKAAVSAQLKLTAKNIAFDTDELEAPANKRLVITFVNAEALPHNVSIYTSDGDEKFKGDLLTSTGNVQYNVPALEAGVYEYRCDVHPTQMKGRVTVE